MKEQITGWMRIGLILPLAAPIIRADNNRAIDLPPALRDFSRRVDGARQQTPRIIAAAEAAAARKVAHPEALLNVTYARQSSFGVEFLNRSGGLAEALPSEERTKLVTDNDIVVFSIRSWEADGETGLAYLRDCRRNGWLLILFASEAGRPAGDAAAASRGLDCRPLPARVASARRRPHPRLAGKHHLAACD